MRQPQLNQTYLSPTCHSSLKDNPFRYSTGKPRTLEQKSRVLSLYQRIDSVNEADPLFLISQGVYRRTAENKKRMRATPVQNLMLDRYSHVVNTIIEQMDNPIKKEISDESIKLNSQKMNILKNLLSKYNSRFLCPNNYNKLINSFGLQIQPIKGLGRFRRGEGKLSDKSKLETLIELAKSQDQFLEEEEFSEEHESELKPAPKLMYGTMMVAKKQQKFRKTLDSRRFTSLASKRHSCPDESKVTSFRGDSDQHNFQNRLSRYREFLFIVNLSNGIYRPLEVEEYKKPVKYYVGGGNNCNLVKSVLKNRFWLEETNSAQEASFVWTQIKVEEFFESEECFEEDLEYKEETQEPSRVKRLHKSTTVPGKKGVKQHQPQEPELKLLTASEYSHYQLIWKGAASKNSFESRARGSKNLRIDKDRPLGKLHNHLPQNYLLGNKKALFYCLKEYYSLTQRDVFQVVPLTFHIQCGTKDPQFRLFLEEYNKRKMSGKPNIWIIKPGESTNRGNGISCSRKIDEIRNLVSRRIQNNQEKRTFILQSYLTRPLLYNRRKFDIRAYMLVTGNNGRIKGYWYQEGYARTSSSFFNLAELDDPMIHLTNDAVQKDGEAYGRFQAGNKITYNQLQRYIESMGRKVDFYDSIYPQMKRIATDAVKSTAIYLDHLKHENNFELFGLDFMIDEDFKVWLIEINTNPCLELSCGILQRLIPHLIQNVFRLAVDPVFPPPSKFPFTKRYNVLQNALHYNKFELIFDQISEGKRLHQLYSNSSLLTTIGAVKEDQDTYESDGEMLNLEDPR